MPCEPDLRLRQADAGDTRLVLDLIRELAAYEDLADRVKLTEEILRGWIAARKVEVLLAECGGKTAGFALFYETYSTFRGQAGLYLEDLFVRPEFRRHGIGTAFFRELARLGKERGCFRVDWMVLNWNRRAMDFYRTLGAAPVADWTTFRLDGCEIAPAAPREE
jgi:GNAT superfamily N-acetyltransferase